MADPQALSIVNAAAQAFDRVGLPEGQFHLTQAALYLATAPKSNSSLAFFDAVKVVEEEAAKEVPNHLRDPSRDKHGFGHGEGYNYPHAYRDHWVAQAYLPEGLKGRIFYQPSAQGYEKGIQNDVLQRRESQMASMIEEPAEVLTYSPGGKQRDSWMRRTTGSTGRFLEEMRTRLFARLRPERHHRLLVWRETGGLFLWEAWRQVPEGGAAVYFPDQKHLNLCEHFARTLPDSERPVLFGGENCGPEETLARLKEEEWTFEGILCRNWLFRTDRESWTAEWEGLKALMAPDSRLITCEPLPGDGSRLTGFMNAWSREIPEWDALTEAEDRVYREWHPRLVSPETAAGEFTESGGNIFHSEKLVSQEERQLSEDLLMQWLDPSRTGSLGNRMAALLDRETVLRYRDEVVRRLKGTQVTWESSYSLTGVSL